MISVGRYCLFHNLDIFCLIITIFNYISIFELHSVIITSYKLVAKMMTKLTFSGSSNEGLSVIKFGVQKGS